MRNRWRSLLRCALSAALLSIPAAGAAAADSPRNHVQFYIEAYGVADPAKYPAVARCAEVFDAVRRVADKRNTRLPQLKVVDGPGDPWAIALPDGHIVLSRRAVDAAYRDLPSEHGDARMAFILGHELAHLAKDDFRHSEVARALAGSADPARELRQAAARGNELAADDLGFVYAALAGYRVDWLLDETTPGRPDFFRDWMRQSASRLDGAYPRPEERARGLRERLRGILNALEFFHFGVRLSRFGRFADAVYFFQEFQQRFPAREVLGNLGYTLLRSAADTLPATLAYRFWLPTALDLDSRADHFTPQLRGDQDLPPAAREQLTVAADYLQRASAADPAYLPARLNLAAAYLLLGEVYKARAAIEEARLLAPDDPEVQNLRAVILYLEGRETDMWPAALKALEELAQRPDASPAVRYNLARLLDERGRAARAAELWEGLGAQAQQLPAPYRAMVCRRLEGQEGDCARTSAPVPDPPWPLPVPVGLDLLSADNDPARLFAGWARTAFDWQYEGMNGHIYQRPDGTASVLVLDGLVDMVVLRGKALGSEDDLLRRCGAPGERRAHGAGLTTWNYGGRWAAVVGGGQVREVWVTRR